MEQSSVTSVPIMPLAEPKRISFFAWINVVVAAVLMLATLPGRTQGLGLITEPMLRDLHLDRVLYADLNLWATLLGAVFCLPAGWLLDRFGLRWTAATTVLLLAAVVWRMSAATGSVAVLFLLILLTRALGQSALSVVSITAVGKSFGRKVGWPMAVYSVLLSLFFAWAFTLIGKWVRLFGWREAWLEVAFGLMIGVVPLILLFLREPAKTVESCDSTEPDVRESGITLSCALRTPTFWIFGGATALYGLVSSGLGLFNEAVLAEHGFDQKTYHTLLAGTTLIALGGQFLCGWITTFWSMPRLLGIAMFIYALALALLPLLKTLTQLWGFAVLMGLSGGMITVVFFGIWKSAFGQIHLGRIQGAAQMLTVVASAVGPLLFAQCARISGSYSPVLFVLSPIVLLMGIAAWKAKPVTNELNPYAGKGGTLSA